MAVDWSQGLSALGAGIDSFTNDIKTMQKQSSLAAIGEQLQSGDYAGAAQKAFGMGDVQTGLGILKLGQQKQQAAALGPLLSADPENFTGVPAAAPPTPTTGSASPVADSSAPRGIRNNNPGNIEDGPFAQRQEGYVGSDGRFARFATMDNGIGAQTSLIGSYGNRGINTVAGVVNRWAPPSENGASTANYINAVAKAVGVDPNQPIDLSDTNVRSRIAAAMRQFENGRPVPGGAAVQVASNNPGFVPQGGATAYAPSAQPAAEPTISDDDYAGPQAGGTAIAAATTPAVPAIPNTPAPPSAPSQDDVKLRNYGKYAAALTLQIARTEDAGQREALKSRLDWTNKQIEKLGKDDAVTTIDPSQYASIPGLNPAYKGVVQRDSKGRLSFPDKATTQVSIDNKTESIAATELAKAKVKDVTDAIEAGRDARTKLGTLAQLADVWNNNADEISTGPGAETILKLKQIGKNLGLDVGNVAPSELVQKIGTQLSAVASKDLTSRPTQFDFQVFLANNPGLTLTAQGNKMLIGLMQQKAKNDLALSALARKQKNGDDWDNVVAEFDKAHPIISPLTGKPLDPNAVIAPGPSQPASGQGRPATNVAPPEALSQAREAIAKGAPRDAVIQRLRQNGIDASGL